MPTNGGTDAPLDEPASSPTESSGAGVGGRDAVAGSLWIGAIVSLAAFSGALLVF